MDKDEDKLLGRQETCVDKDEDKLLGRQEICVDKEEDKLFGRQETCVLGVHIWRQPSIVVGRLKHDHARPHFLL